MDVAALILTLFIVLTQPTCGRYEKVFRLPDKTLYQPCFVYKVFSAKCISQKNVCLLRHAYEGRST